MNSSAISDVVIGGVQVTAALVTAPVARHWYNRWGASEAEAASAMPGDGLIARPQLGYTRAITIDAPPSAVWPWLVQLGRGRGGLYSFDGLENVVRCDIHSADRILDQHQDLAVGDLIRLGPQGYPCFRVVELVPAAALVLLGADPRPPHSLPAADAPGGLCTWQWELRAQDDGRTRLLARQRLAYPRSMSVMWHVVEPVAFVMERKMLAGIKERAERTAGVHGGLP